MTPEEIREKSRILMEKLLRNSALSECPDHLRLPVLQPGGADPAHSGKGLEEGKRVAVPKVYGEEMRFLYLEDLSQVAPGYGGIPEPIADSPVAEDPHALVLMPGLPLTGGTPDWATAAGFTTGFWQRSRSTPRWLCATNFRWWRTCRWKALTCRWIWCSAHK